MYKTDTKNKAKKLRVITFATAKLQGQKLNGKQKKISYYYRNIGKINNLI